ncbi:phytanoyl-CoA dioxygenase family protein [Dyadobacter sp. CY343]|uniref:phytanoyl-CoA dioxygenase family protein n=1 Tax=Dyadobacter sp. CY343 TaxID=2907299 RepID=UPI001F18FFC4|nr:phytanoyl-CoA dioxygenase family protein [Dyadobacter sp. CY343]MCE7058541.1 phytanoyl-CoA dioxygenase family protein [Dyadobacter sp. CY343]
MHHNSPWTESPFFESELEKSDLSPEMKEKVRFYSENGYLIIDPEIPETLLDEAREGLLSEFSNRKSTRIQDIWKENEKVRQIAIAPKILDLLQVLYRKKPIPFQTLNFNVGTQQRTHSDTIHFDCIPQRFMCGVWVALEDVKQDNGPLHYYPGSHKYPIYNLLDMGIMGSASKSMEDSLSRNYQSYEDFIEEFVKVKKLTPETLHIKKGQAIIWSANLLHGGNKIERPGATRHSQVTHYYFEDCVYYAPLLTDMAIERINIREITDIQTGQKVKSSYNHRPISNTGYSYKVYLPTHILRTVVPESLRKRVKSLLFR